MRQSILQYPRHVILCDGKPVGVISCRTIDQGIYEIGCLCVIPEFQEKGIGTKAVEFVRSYYDDWTKFYVITPAEKEENIRFYTQKCGFETDSSLMDGNVEAVRFILQNHFFGKEWDPNETSADR